MTLLRCGRMCRITTGQKMLKNQRFEHVSDVIWTHRCLVVAEKTTKKGAFWGRGSMSNAPLHFGFTWPPVSGLLSSITRPLQDHHL